MKILLLNGSPRKGHSNTLKITNAFLDGLCGQNNHEIKTVVISRQNIQPCKGCFGCWGKTPGVCVQKDDMTELLNLYRDAELVIWSFPLYYFGMPSGIKAFTDRLMPNNLPSMVESKRGGIRHPQRYDFSHQKHILISTCGFQSTFNNFEALEKQFDIMFGDSLVKITCPEGGIFGADEPSRPIREYLEKVRCAGRDYAATGTLPLETQRSLSKAIFDPKTYMIVQNIVMESMTLKESPNPDKPLNEKAYEFMKKMLAEFTSQTCGKTPVVIEIFFDDLCNTFQFHIKNNTCCLYTEHTKDYTTRLEIPFGVWKEIISQKSSLSQAFIDRKYKMLGDFNTILRFDDFFPVIP